MAYGIIISVAALTGIVYGIKTKNRILAVLSFLVLAATLAV